MAYKEKAKKTAYQNEFIKQAYDRINLTVPKGRKEEVQAVAEQRGQSVNGFINGLIDAALSPAGSPEGTGGGGGFGFLIGSPEEIMCSRFISQSAPDFQTVLTDSGQSTEEFIAQAIRERVERERRP